MNQNDWHSDAVPPQAGLALVNLLNFLKAIMTPESFASIEDLVVRSLSKKCGNHVQ